VRKTSLPVRFIRSSSTSYRSKEMPRKIHASRDSKDYEYSRALCGSRDLSAWLKVVPQDAEVLVESANFCTGCRKILAGALKKSWR
jgi:hypothetical protein